MYLRNLSESLRRRWYLVVVGLCVVGGLAGLTYAYVPPTYQANANVVLLPPHSTVLAGGNPYLYLGGLSQALDVLTRALDADTTREGILGARTDLDYAVEPDPTTSGPILVVQATGPTAAETLQALIAVLDAVPVNLRQLQDDLQVSLNSQITSMTLTVDRKPAVVGKNRLRAVIGVAALGATAMSLLIGAVDGALLSRARRKAEPDPSSPASGAAPGRTRRPSSPVPAHVPEPGRLAGEPVAAPSGDGRSFDEVVGLRADARASVAPEVSQEL